ncbi:hypothetical protein QJQ45_007761 [Haematococcus lacustris]|nr:hypothetical protein QJQ45_007761 [Haematococcus lacustris]
MAPLAQLVTAIPADHANLADVQCGLAVVADWSRAATRPLVLEEPASLALFCTGLAPDLGPAPEVMPACCAAFTGVALKVVASGAAHEHERSQEPIAGRS